MERKELEGFKEFKPRTRQGRHAKNRFVSFSRCGSTREESRQPIFLYIGARLYYDLDIGKKKHRAIFHYSEAKDILAIEIIEDSPLAPICSNLIMINRRLACAALVKEVLGERVLGNYYPARAEQTDERKIIYVDLTKENPRQKAQER